MTLYRHIKIADNGEPILLAEPHGFFVEPFYFNKGIAPSPEVKLREGVLGKLKEAAKNLPKGWNFKIFDGYRILETQKQLFDSLYNYYRDRHPGLDHKTLYDKTEIFVAVPRHDKTHPSPHNTGGAVDLTIIDANGNEINMGTSFDEFSERGLAFTSHFEDKDSQIHKRRMLLKELLESFGFQNYEHEWWHYSFGDQMWALKSAALYAIYGSVELK